MKRRARHAARGATLVELLVSIVVISIAGAALASTLAYLNGAGGTSILQAQAQSIANAHLNEISGKSFLDPDGVDGEGPRAQFDNVDDYNGLDNAVARDAFGNASGNFRVRVSVVAAALGGLPAANVRRIDVTVSYGDSGSIVATGYRTRYP